MKTPSTTAPGRAPARWDKLVQQAASDSPPPVDAVALLRAVSRASAQAVPPAAGQTDWQAELPGWLSARRVIPACVAAACALAASAAWQIAEAWTALDWAQWGGAL